MDWSNERYVRLYTRDTETVLLQSWQARAIHREMLRKCDRAGVIECSGPRGLAVILNIPAEVVEEHLPRLTCAEGPVRWFEKGYVMPNFIEAQEAPMTDKQRAKQSRERRRDHAKAGVAVTKRDGSVTERDSGADATESEGTSQNVTIASHNERFGHKTNENVTPRHTASHRVTPALPAVLAVPYQPNQKETDTADTARARAEPTTNGNPDVVHATARRLTVAANRATADKFGEQTKPLIASSGPAHTLAVAVLAASVPVEFAERSVVRQVLALAEPVVSSMAYFRAGILSDWERQVERVAAAVSAPVAPLESRARHSGPVSLATALLQSLSPDLEPHADRPSRHA